HETQPPKKELPDYGKQVITPDGKGKLVRLNLLSRNVKVRLHGREIAADYEYEEIKEATANVAAVKGDQNG
ncbi:signal peptidase, partial [Enterococcus faecalis]